MRVSPDGDVLESERELEEVGEEIAELEEQIARKRARHAQLHGEQQMTTQEKAKAIRRTMGKCAKALGTGHISLEKFAEIACAARGVQATSGGPFAKGIGAHPNMSLNQASMVSNLTANGMGHLVNGDGSWR